MNVEDAVMMLQRHERARQGRLRAKLMLEIRRQENAEKNKGRYYTLSVKPKCFFSIKFNILGL